MAELLAHPSRGGCGVGALADPRGPSRELLDWALAGLAAMEHRGGTLEGTGDGAGLLLGVDPAWFGRFVAHGKHVPSGEQLCVGTVSLPAFEGHDAWRAGIDALLRLEGLMPLGWRRVPVCDEALGRVARESRRDLWHVLIGEGLIPRRRLALALFKAKQRIESQMRDLYLPSFAPRTVAYKALCTGAQLARTFPDLADRSLTTDAVLFHRRYSTNTFSNDCLAQPFRLLAHNGEINSIRSNRDATHNLEGEIRLRGVLMKQGSDSADLDRVVELFTVHGVPLLETVVRLMPPAWRDEPGFPPEIADYLEGVRRALGSLGAWEGPAGIVASDGEVVLAHLDRMGLRPLRYLVTRGGRLVVSSEIGAVPVPEGQIAEVGQLDPGESIALDLRSGRLLRPGDVFAEVVSRSPINTAELARSRLYAAPSLGPIAGDPPARSAPALFGWSHERIRTLRQMAQSGTEALSSMGWDRPLAVFSKEAPPLFKYFKQIIAVVTNPPIDPLREGTAIDLSVFLGRTPRAFLESTEYRVFPQIRLESPVVDAAQLRGIVHGGAGLPEAARLDATYPFDGGAKALSDRIDEIAREALRLARHRLASILVLSDRRALASRDRLPLPALLAAGALHAALTREGRRRRVSLVVETGEVQEPHDLAVLLANGADAVCPWLAFDLAHEAFGDEGVARLRQAFDSGLKRVMSKMGITSLDGYRGARLFEAVGVSETLVDYYLFGTVSRLGGVDLADLDSDIRRRARARDEGAIPRAREDLGVFRKDVLRQLYLVSRGSDAQAWSRFLDLLGQSRPVYLRDLLAFRTRGVVPVPLERVAPAREIVASTIRGAAISHGALHRIAHRAIAGALNELGSRSNSGEGGEDPRRNRGQLLSADRSRTRQVASGRFGVEVTYLVNADELQIKIGQGAKPGEGGHLPAGKVTAEIAAIRHCPPGVALISPPPHHDIYSIEDLAQLIHNLRAVHPAALISVKCPSVTDLGTIAVGVVKAGADVIEISGFEGGTGAALASSIEHAGLPLERGLSESHQALVLNGIRDTVKLRADGGVKAGDDVLKLLALGADEVSVGTALMVAEMCTYCHTCMKGLCPSGITTQDPTVFQRFMVGHGPARRELAPDTAEEVRYQQAKEGVKRYLLALAEDVRRGLSRLGLRHPCELVGRVDLLDQVPCGHPRADKVDLSALLIDPRLHRPQGAARDARGAPRPRPPSLNARILDDVRRARAERVELHYAVCNQDRATGASLAGAFASGAVPRPPGGTVLKLRGFAGQGLGFALAEGIVLELEGLANDGVGEAMSGGRIVVRQPACCRREGNSVAGNAVGYGAVGGEIFLEGRAGQRLGVRNSGAVIVAEGAGKYAFEYMTHGIGVVLGPMGPVVGSGLNGGVVFAHDPTSATRARLHADAGATPVLLEEREKLRALVERHRAMTGSPVARRLLERWEQARDEFIAVRPAAEARRLRAAEPSLAVG